MSCQSQVENQYALKGSSPFCMNCVNDPLTLVNLFSGEMGPHSQGSSSLQAGRSSVQSSLPAASTVPEIAEMEKKLDEIDRRLKVITDEEIAEGKGSQLMTEMKTLMSRLKDISRKHPLVSFFFFFFFLKKKKKNRGSPS